MTTTRGRNPQAPSPRDFLGNFSSGLLPALVWKSPYRPNSVEKIADVQTEKSPINEILSLFGPEKLGSSEGIEVRISSLWPLDMDETKRRPEHLMKDLGRSARIWSGE